MVKTKNHMAKTYSQTVPVVSQEFSTMSIKERVRRAHDKRIVTVVGFSHMPKMTVAIEKEVALGRPIINQ